MAKYCYTNKEEGTIIRRFPITGNIPEHITLGGKRYDRDIRSEHSSFKHTYGSGWPMKSIAAAVSPDQVQDAMEIDRRAGVPTEYTKHGEPIWRNPGHRKRYLKAHNLYDRNSFF
jgi:hypothetical protein